MRKALAPLSTIFFKIALEEQAGPKVAIILVERKYISKNKRIRSILTLRFFQRGFFELFLRNLINKFGNFFCELLFEIIQFLYLFINTLQIIINCFIPLNNGLRKLFL